MWGNAWRNPSLFMLHQGKETTKMDISSEAMVAYIKRNREGTVWDVLVEYCRV